jgi:hypothetical protein
MIACVGALVMKETMSRVLEKKNMVSASYLLLVFFNLMALLGSLNQLISVPSMMIPILSPSEPSKVEIERTVAFMITPR